jgi:hypothetical protein
LPPPCSYILDTLLRHGLVTDDVAASVRQFIADNQTDKPGVIPAAPAAKPQYKRCDGMGVGVEGRARAGVRGAGGRQCGRPP